MRRIKSMLYASLFISCTVVLLLAAGCNSDNSTAPKSEPGPDPAPPVVQLMSHSDCLNISYAAGNNDECFDYSFDSSGVLTVIHHNAAFNCCPDSIYAEIDQTDNTITLHEHEGLTMPCDCLCLYDIEYRIENLESKSYTLIFDGPYVHAGDPMLTGTLNLATDPEGSVCQERGYYPWPLPPSGILTNFSDCLSSQSAEVPQTCVDFNFDGYGALELTHVNAWYNCCLDSITAAFTFSDDSIIVGESEWLAGGGCDCVCPININLMIENLPPGIYTLVIGNATVDPVARQSMVLDLSHPINSSYCFDE